MAKKNKNKAKAKAAVPVAEETQKKSAPHYIALVPIAEEDEDFEDDAPDDEASIVYEEEDTISRNLTGTVEEPLIKDVNSFIAGMASTEKDLLKMEKDTRPVKEEPISPTDYLVASLALVASGSLPVDVVAAHLREALAELTPRQRRGQGQMMVEFMTRIRHAALKLSAIADEESKR